jgi:DNA-binding MarR family transcriptional regulator
MSPRQPPIDRIALDAWRAVLTAQALVVRRVERALAAAELPPLSWYDVLYALYRAPRKRLRIHQLADAVVLSPTGMSRLVDRLEAAGHLRREAVEDDRRGAFAVLTDSGLACLRRMWPVYERALATHVAGALGEDATAVRDALRRVGDSAR